MKNSPIILATMLAGIFCAPLASSAHAASGQAFVSSVASLGVEGGSTEAGAVDSSLFADGSRAINANRWSDAASIFAKVASQRGAHADAAFYWKAYAENKLGKSKTALDTCGELRHDYPKSSWIEECGALEIEIHARNGQPVQPKTEKDENLKLLALNALMIKDEPRALQQLREILQGNFTERFKVGAIYILAMNPSKQTRELLAEVAQMKINAPHSLQSLAAAGLEGRLPGMSHPAAGGNRDLTLNVVVNDPSGQPVSGLQAGEFKLLDNNQPQSMVSFEAASGASDKTDSPTEVVLVLDAINSSPLAIGNDRLWLEKYFASNGSQLALPTSLALLTDRGMKIQNQPTRDGKVLLGLLDNNQTGLPSIQRSEGFWGAVDRRDLSLKSLGALTSTLGNTPCRKLVIWIGPGWSAMSGETYYMSSTEKEGLFHYIASLGTALRNANITLYSVDPDLAGVRTFYYETFYKEIASPRNADHGDLMVQVLAHHTGGRVLVDDDNLERMINQCISDANVYYVLTFHPPSATHANEYHGIEVQVDKPELKARTRTGYYAQP